MNNAEKIPVTNDSPQAEPVKVRYVRPIPLIKAGPKTTWTELVRQMLAHARPYPVAWVKTNNEVEGWAGCLRVSRSGRNHF